MDGSHSEMKKLMAYLFMAVTVYLIWQERNIRIHNSGRARTAEQVLQLAKQMVHEKLHSCNCFKKAIKKDMSLLPLLY